MPVSPAPTGEEGIMRVPFLLGVLCGAILAVAGMLFGMMVAG